MTGAALIVLSLVVMSLILIFGALHKRITSTQAIWVIIAGVLGPTLGAIIFPYLPPESQLLFGLISFRVVAAIITYFTLSFVLLFMMKNNIKKAASTQDEQEEFRKIIE